jgi:hypothetical protein
MASDTKDIGLLAQPKVDTFMQKVENSAQSRPTTTHAHWCRCPSKPWCEEHDSATTDPMTGICQSHDHHIG